MGHQVFIERCRDSAPESAVHLATTLAERYGIPPEQILSRLKKGRFRVKANLGFAEAREFMSYVEAHGALCTIVDTEGQIAVRSMGLSETVRGRPMQPPTPAPQNDLGTSDTVRVAEPIDAGDFGLTLMTPLPPEDPTEIKDDDAGDSGFRLSTLDGESPDDPAATLAAKAIATGDVSAFLPPEMMQETALELDVEPPAPVSQRRSAVSPVVSPEPAPPPPQQRRTPAAVAAVAAPRASASVSTPRVSASVSTPRVSASVSAPSVPPHLRALGFLERSTRARFAVGITLALLIGFLAAHTFASLREDSRYEDARAQLREDYAGANTVARWEALDEARDNARATLKTRQSSIATTSVLIWLVVGGLFGFAWIRFIDWSRFALRATDDRSTSS